MVVALSMDERIDAVRETADDLISDLQDGNIVRDDAQQRKDDLLEEIEDIQTTLRGSDGRITTIET